MFQVPLGGPYDLIIASHVFHHFSEQRCLELLQRLAEVLKTDGRLVIHDFVSGPQPAQAPFPYLFSVRMLTWTREGQAYSLDTYRKLLQEAGFSEPEVHASQARAESGPDRRTGRGSTLTPRAGGPSAQMILPPRPERAAGCAGPSRRRT